MLSMMCNCVMRSTRSAFAPVKCDANSSFEVCLATSVAKRHSWVVVQRRSDKSTFIETGFLHILDRHTNTDGTVTQAGRIDYLGFGETLEQAVFSTLQSWCKDTYQLQADSVEEMQLMLALRGVSI